MTPDLTRLLQNSVLLRGAPAAAHDKIIQASHGQCYSRGGTVFIQGERADAIYLVAKGWVKLYRIAPNGAEAVVGIFTRGRSFGEAVALTDAEYPVSAEAVTDCTLVRIDAATYIRTIRENPDIALGMLASTYVHLHNLVSQVEALKAQTGPQRVAEFLLELADGDEGRCEVVLPYDKVLIAGRLGMKPESLSRAFAKLKGYGVTVRQNRATIDSLNQLREYADEDPGLAWSAGRG